MSGKFMYRIVRFENELISLQYNISYIPMVVLLETFSVILKISKIRSDEFAHALQTQDPAGRFVCSFVCLFVPKLLLLLQISFLSFSIFWMIRCRRLVLFSSFVASSKGGGACSETFLTERHMVETRQWIFITRK